MHCCAKLSFTNEQFCVLLTNNQTDRLEKKGKIVHVLPAHHYLSK